MNETALQNIVAKFGVSSFTAQAILYTAPPNMPAEERGCITRVAVADELAAKDDGGMVIHPEMKCEHCAADNVPEWRRNGKIIWRTWPDGRPGEWACHYCGRAA